MNSLQLEYFFALSKYKNFSETARRLYVAQPSISKQIAALEDELDMELFSRIKGSVQLTEKGEIMLKAFERMQIIYDNAKKDALQLSEESSYKFHIAFIQGTDVGGMVSSTLNLLKHKFPDINFIADCYSHEQLNKALYKNEVDLAITVEYEIKEDNLLKFILLQHINQAIIVQPDHPLAQKEDLDYDLLQRQIFLVSDVGTRSFKKYCNTLVHNFGIKQENIVVVPNVETLILNVESGVGVALLGETPRIKSSKDIKLFPVSDLPPIGIYATWKYNNVNYVRDLFIHALKENL